MPFILDGIKYDFLPNPLPQTLKRLVCYNNHLTSLPPLQSSLKRLICYNNRLIFLPPLPPSLEWLNCSNNQLTSLPPLPPSLKKLVCYNNQLTSLPPLPTSLKVLNCDSNPLKYPKDSTIDEIRKYQEEEYILFKENTKIVVNKIKQELGYSTEISFDWLENDIIKQY